MGLLNGLSQAYFETRDSVSEEPREVEHPARLSPFPIEDPEDIEKQAEAGDSEDPFQDPVSVVAESSGLHRERTVLSVALSLLPSYHTVSDHDSDEDPVLPDPLPANRPLPRSPTPVSTVAVKLPTGPVAEAVSSYRREIERLRQQVMRLEGLTRPPQYDEP